MKSGFRLTCVLWVTALAVVPLFARAELPYVMQGASDAKYLREELKDAREWQTKRQEAYEECLEHRKEKKEKKRGFSEGHKNMCHYSCLEANQPGAVNNLGAGTLCTHSDFEMLGNFSPPSENACASLSRAQPGSGHQWGDVSQGCRLLIERAMYNCREVREVVESEPELDLYCEDLKIGADSAKEQYDKVKEELEEVRRACPECEMLAAMKPRTPNTWDYLLAGVQAIAPTVMQGMAMNAYTSIIKDQAGAYANMWGQYMSYCQETGIPCMSPAGPVNGYGMGGGYGNPWGMGGGFMPPMLGGGMPIGGGLQPFGGGGMGGGPIPLGTGFTGGPFTPLLPGNSMTNGFGMPMYNFGTGFNSALFAGGPWGGTGFMGGGGMGGLGGMGGAGWGYPGMGGFGGMGGMASPWPIDLTGAGFGGMGGMGGFGGLGGMGMLGMGGFPYGGNPYGSMAYGMGGNPFTPGLMGGGFGAGLNFNVGLGMGLGGGLGGGVGGGVGF
jgi:hypothetical protein